MSPAAIVRPNARRLLAYGFLGLPLAFAALPIYVHVPRYYAESAGLPLEVREQFPPERQLRLPMRPGQRSLNLSNAVAVTVFEAWRQNGFLAVN